MLIFSWVGLPDLLLIQNSGTEQTINRLLDGTHCKYNL